MIKKFDKFLENAGATTGVVGSGTAVGGGAGSGDMGSFTSAAGMSVSGGDSGTAFSTNSNTSGMGSVKSSQPSNIPGDVAGSEKGSGDIGGKPFGIFTKSSANIKKKRKNKKDRDYTKRGEHIDNFYTTKYTENFTNGNLVTSWEAFTERKIFENTTEFNLCGIDLDEKGRFGQKLTDIFLIKDSGYLKIGQLRKLGSYIFYPDFRSIESGNFTNHIIDDGMCRDLTVEEENIILNQLKKEKKLGNSLMDEIKTYYDILNDKINEEINWNKQPFKFFKNIFKLEEPDDGDISEDDLVKLQFNINLSVFSSGPVDYTIKSLDKLARKYNLIGNIEHLGSSQYSFDLEGIKKDADDFYEEVRDLLK